MAKDKKDGKGSAAALPKSIAGAKLPKDIRKKLTELAQHPAVADLIAAGLVALAAKIKKEPEAQKEVAKVRGKAVEVVTQAVAGVAEAIAKPAGAAPAAKRVRTPAAKTPAKPAAQPKASAKTKAAAKPKAPAKPRASAKAPKPAK
ncbi:hypothetical protein [Sphingomonas sp.]|jgi:hypothetical protein|uniref:hypothetical protein n=1 Tax=Sphingomonas sp. TaxID=28214 RepID=UPI002ED9DC46